jgi:hypothetical protein
MSSIWDYAKEGIFLWNRKAPEKKHAPQQKVRFDDSSPMTLLERLGNKGTADNAKEFAKDGSEGVRSLGVSCWWQQDSPRDCQEKIMRETFLVSNKLVSLLLSSPTKKHGSTGARKDKDDQEQSLLENVQDACNVELALRPHLGGLKMQGLAITGTGAEREKAKTMIARLASSCHVDSLSTVTDAWQDLSSPCRMHAFMSGCADHEFGVLTPLGDPENVGEKRHGLQPVDMKSLRIKQASHGWRSELDSLRGDPAFVRGAHRQFQWN